jgi:hypothetical protein
VNWEPISRTKVDVRGVHSQFPGLLDVRVLLSTNPPQEWSRAFDQGLGVSQRLSLPKPELTGGSVAIRCPDDELQVNHRWLTWLWRAQRQLARYEGAALTTAG